MFRCSQISFLDDGRGHHFGRIAVRDERPVVQHDDAVGQRTHHVPVVLNLIAQLKQDASKIILLVEHKMDVVRSLADRIIVLHNGQLVADGKPAEVIASPIVQEAYLGIAPGRSAA